MILSIQMI